MEEDPCPYCDGSGYNLTAIKHTQTGIDKLVSQPCFCYCSRLISSENSILGGLGGQYTHPDKLDPLLDVNFSDLALIPNYLIAGNTDDFLLQIKALLMKYRFDSRHIKILLSRSIDVIQDFHVPQGIEEEAPKKLSFLTNFDLVILEFETAEHNKALAPGMHQVVWTRIEEKKPVWVFFRSGFGNMTSCNEQSPGLLELFNKHFQQIELKASQNIIQNQSESKNLATTF